MRIIQSGMLRALWDYRGFVHSSIRNEFSARFARIDRRCDSVLLHVGSTLKFWGIVNLEQVDSQNKVVVT